MAIEGVGNKLTSTEMNKRPMSEEFPVQHQGQLRGALGLRHRELRGTTKLSVGLPGAQIPLDAVTRLGETQLRSTSPPPHIMGEG